MVFPCQYQSKVDISLLLHCLILEHGYIFHLNSFLHHELTGEPAILTLDMFAWGTSAAILSIKSKINCTSSALLDSK